MFPVLFKLGPIVLYSYGLMLFLGFFFSLFIIWKKSVEEHYEGEEVFDVLLSSSFFAMIGARILYIVLNFGSFGWDGIAWFNILGKPGFALFGAMAAGGVNLYLQTKKRKWDFYEFADIVSTGLALVFVFSWMGAFLNGSGFGLPTDSIVGMRFVGMFDKRHPVQLYAFFLYILLFIYLAWVEGKYRTFAWYRAGRSGSKSGFLMHSFLLSSGFIGMIVAVFSPPSISLLGQNIDTYLWGLFMIWGLVGLYNRSGRTVARDWEQITGGKKKKSARKERVEKRRTHRRRGRHTGLGNDIL